jgi:hypothetical protein
MRPKHPFHRPPEREYSVRNHDGVVVVGFRVYFNDYMVDLERDCHQTLEVSAVVIQSRRLDDSGECMVTKAKVCSQTSHLEAINP